MTDEQIRAVALIAAAFCSTKLGNNSEQVLWVAGRYEAWLRGGPEGPPGSQSGPGVSQGPG